MGERFASQVALVTGASSGIGRAVALALAGEGAEVGVHYHSGRDRAEAVVAEIEAAGGRAFALPADVADGDSVRALFAAVRDRRGRLDVLVNNAGEWMGRHPIAECPDELWHQMIAVNLDSLFYCCRAALEIMLPQGSGAIVNVLSIAGHTGGGGGTVPYAAAKGGGNALTRGLAKEVAAGGVRVNAVSPGLIDTPMQERWTGAEKLGEWARLVPMKRIGAAAEVVGAVLFLASAEASYVTGEILEVNGGLLMR